jgi:hypothetical protein
MITWTLPLYLSAQVDQLNLWHKIRLSRFCPVNMVTWATGKQTWSDLSCQNLRYDLACHVNQLSMWQNIRLDPAIPSLGLNEPTTYPTRPCHVYWSRRAEDNLSENSRSERSRWSREFVTEYQTRPGSRCWSHELVTKYQTRSDWPNMWPLLYRGFLWVLRLKESEKTKYHFFIQV